MKKKSSVSRATSARVFLILTTTVQDTATNETVCPMYELGVANSSKLEVKTSSALAMLGGTMLCTFPTNLPDPEVSFPLIVFGHGGGVGGFKTGMYEKFMREVASAGFVVCAPRQCLGMCPDVFETHILNAGLLYTSQAAEELLCVDPVGRRLL